MQIAFLGLGLIGGSIVRALRQSASTGPASSAGAAFDGAVVSAWSPSGVGPRAARAEGLIDEAAGSAGEAVGGADLVVLCAPPLHVLALLDELAGPLRGSLGDGGVVTDVASTKALIVARAESLGLPFVGGHPMAGREATGYGASAGDLFRDRPWVVVPGRAAAGEVARVEALAVACGARPTRLSAAEHDAAVAAVSHLPLALSAALVEAVAGGAGAEPPADWQIAAGLAASGWRDMTRLARGDAKMGAGIAATNAAELALRLRALRDVIDGWLADLERDGGPDVERIAARLRAARERLEAAP